MKTFFILAAFVLTCTTHAQSTDGMTLAALVEDVLQHNPGYRATQLTAKSATAKISQSSAWNAPTVGVGFMENPITSLNFPKDGMMRQYSIEQMIPFPGKISAAEEGASAGAFAAKSSSDAYRRTLIAEVKKAYAMLYSVQKRLSVNADNTVLLQQMIAAAQAKYSVGQATQADILRLQIELSKLGNERSTLQQEKRTTEGMVNSLRGKPAGTDLGRIADIPLTAPPADVEALQDSAAINRFEISAMKSDISMMRADVTMAERERWPDLMVGLNYKERVAIPDTWELMVGVSIPIAPWTSGRTNGRIEEAQLTAEAGESKLHDMTNMIRFEVYDAWSQCTASWEKLERYKNDVLPSSRQTLESLQSSYVANKTDFLSLIDSFRMLEMYTMEYYMETAKYLSARADLERAVGRDIE